MRRVLFLCTGNFYRSRFAEALFNHHAAQMGLPWRAVSRGLAIHLAEGDLSPYTLEALTQRGIDLQHTGATRARLCQEDLEAADLVVAVCEREHRPLMQGQFPDWELRTRFWCVDDNDVLDPAEALPNLEAVVMELLEELRRETEAETASPESAAGVP